MRAAVRYLIGNVLPGTGRAQRLELAPQRLAHGLYAVANDEQVLAPLGAQVVLGQHEGDGTGGKGDAGRHGAAQDAHEVDLGGRQEGRVVQEQVKGAETLAVEAHVLAKGLGHAELHAGPAGKVANGPGVDIGVARSEALAGECEHREGERGRQGRRDKRLHILGIVKKGKDVPLLNHVGYGPPLLLRRVDSGRVLRAGLQDDDVARLRGAEGSNGALKVELFLGRVVVGVLLLLDVVGGNVPYVAVVEPGRVGDPDGGRLALQADQQLGADMAGAGSGNGLDRGQPRRELGGLGPKEQLAGGLDKGREAFAGNVVVHVGQTRQCLSGHVDHQHGEQEDKNEEGWKEKRSGRRCDS